MKICRECKLEKELTEYYKDRSCKFGVGSVCKECRKVERREKYLKNREHELRRNKIWAKNNPEKVAAIRKRGYYKKPLGERSLATIKSRKKREAREPGYRRILNIRSAQWERDNPIKAKAHYLVREAVRKGEMLEPNKCQYPTCFSEYVEGHHFDYSKPYDVVWLCKKHHALADQVRRTYEKALEYRAKITL